MRGPGEAAGAMGGGVDRVRGAERPVIDGIEAMWRVGSPPAQRRRNKT